MIDIVGIYLCLTLYHQYSTKHQGNRVNKQRKRNEFKGEGKFIYLKIVQQFPSCYTIFSKNKHNNNNDNYLHGSENICQSPLH